MRPILGNRHKQEIAADVYMQCVYQAAEELGIPMVHDSVVLDSLAKAHEFTNRVNELMEARGHDTTKHS